MIYRDISNPEAVGGDFYLWELARGLAALGHSVTLLCSSFKGSKPQETREGVQILRVKNSLSLPLRMFKTYLVNLKGRFDVVIEEIIGGQRFPFFGVLYAGVPLVAVWHQRNAKVFLEQYPFFMALPLSGIEYLLSRFYRRATVLTPSEGAKAELGFLGLDSEKVQVVYDGVDDKFLDVDLARDREDIVVCLGKLRRYKRIDHAILAFKKVVDNIQKPAKLVVAGKLSEIDRGYLDRLRQLAEQLGIKGSVEFRVNISEDEKLDLLRHSKVLVQPSPVEGFSIVVAEANRCGTPVVVSDGVPFDVVQHGVNGYVYRFGDLDHFATEVAKLLNDEDTWTCMSRNAYGWSKQFTWKSSTQKLEQILEELVFKKHHRLELTTTGKIKVLEEALTS
jgi:glycosyltransferase involved in cell wall biosynthesis